MQSLHSTISQIIEATDSPELSLRVLHRGQIIQTAHFGRRNIDEPHPRNQMMILSIKPRRSPKLIAAGAVA